MDKLLANIKIKYIKARNYFCNKVDDKYLNKKINSYISYYELSKIFSSYFNN